MITVHHLESSRSHRVLWLLEELEVPYEIRRYARDPVTSQAPPALREVHPLGKSPVITDGEATVAESGAIVEYLVETYGDGRLVPEPGTEAHRRYRYFMHYAEGSLMPYLTMKVVFRKVETAPLPFFVRPIAKGIAGKVNATFLDPNLKRHLDFLEDALERHDWFAGDDFTGADVQMAFPLEAAAVRAPFGEGRPRLTAYLERVRARPAWQRAVERGGGVGVVD